jgi:hypothetical protein
MAEKSYGCGSRTSETPGGARQFQIFDLHVLQNWAVAEVARILRVSATQVYLAKHCISRLLTKEVAKLERGQETGATAPPGASGKSSQPSTISTDAD